MSNQDTPSIDGFPFAQRKGALIQRMSHLPDPRAVVAQPRAPQVRIPKTNAAARKRGSLTP